jgi:Chaperone of endosialidase
MASLTLNGSTSGAITLAAPAVAGSNTLTLPAATGTLVTSESASISGNLTFTGTGNRITGDFSNATVANRVMFQSSTTNGNTVVSALPNGTAVTSGIRAYNNSDLSNNANIIMSVDGTLASIQSQAVGTGSYLPMTFYTGGSERMRIDTSGNVGIGTSSPVAGYRLNVVNDSGNAQQLIRAGTNFNSTISFGDQDSSTSGQLLYAHNGDYMRFDTNGTERMRIDSSGNVGIGTSSPSYGLDISGTTANKSSMRLANGTAGSSFLLQTDTSGLAYVQQQANAALVFATNNSERARIDSSGNLLVGTTTANARVYGVSGGNSPVGRFDATLTSGYTSEAFQVICGQPSGTGFKIATFYINNAAAYAAYIRGDGTIFAVSTTIQAISDERLKENIVDSTDGLNIITALKPRRFDWKEGQGNGKKNQLGFIAQEIEQVFPEATDTWGESDDPENPYKSVGSGTLIPVLVKAIQELKAENDALNARIAALEAK